MDATDAALAAIEVAQVSKRFGDGPDNVIALDQVSLQIRAGEFFTLLGPSGCGKTTLLRLIAGFEHPSDGAIYLHGTEISGLPPYARSINTVFQSYALFPHMTVAENIGFGLQMLGRSRAEVKTEVGRMLALVRMEALAGRRTDQLSGGQQQRVALARALAPRPQVLLLDEPLSALDYKLRKEMQVELKRLQAETGITFIFVTHDQEEALTMSDRMAVMSDGRVLQVGTPVEIYDRPHLRFVAEFIGDANFIEGQIVLLDDNGAKVRLDSGATIEAKVPIGFSQPNRATIVIRPEHLQVTEFGKGDFEGRVETINFLGTDTIYGVDVGEGVRLAVRVQNRGGSTLRDQVGDRLGLSALPGAAQVLSD